MFYVSIQYEYRRKSLEELFACVNTEHFMFFRMEFICEKKCHFHIGFGY